MLFHSSVLTLAEFDKGIHQLSDDDPLRTRCAANRNAIQTRFGDRVVPLTNAIVRRWGALAGQTRRLA